MAKTDYTKVEEYLEKGLRKMDRDKLLEEADRRTPDRPKNVLDRLNELEKKRKQAKGKEKKDEKPLSVRERAHRHMLEALKRDITKLLKKDRSAFRKLGISKEEISKFIDDPNALSAEEWQKIKDIRGQLDSYKKEMLKTVEEGLEDKIIADERKKHINKRFNVREGWLPLH